MAAKSTVHLCRWHPALLHLPIGIVLAITPVIEWPHLNPQVISHRQLPDGIGTFTSSHPNHPSAFDSLFWRLFTVLCALTFNNGTRYLSPQRISGTNRCLQLQKRLAYFQFLSASLSMPMSCAHFLANSHQVVEGFSYGYKEFGIWLLPE